MLSGLNSTGHEIGGTLGIAMFTSIAAAVSGGITGQAARPASPTRSSSPRTSRPWAASQRSIVLPAARIFLAEAAAQPAGDGDPLSTRSGVTSTPPAPVTPGPEARRPAPAPPSGVAVIRRVLL